MVNEDVYQEIKRAFDQGVKELGLEGHVWLYNDCDNMVRCDVNILYAHGRRRLAVNELLHRLNALPCMNLEINGSVDEDWFGEDYAKEYEVDPEFPEEKDSKEEVPFFVKDGFWTHGEVDEKMMSDWEAECAAEEAREEAEYQAERKERHEHYRDYLLPIPPPPKDAVDEAYLVMDYENYDLIKSGEKTTEFRKYGAFYLKRLCSHPIKTVKLQRGYGGPGHPPPETMVFKVAKISLYELDGKIECAPGQTDIPILPDFIAIDLGERIEDPTTRTVCKVDAKAVFEKRVWGIVRGPGDEMMKAKFQGEEVNVLPLNKVALYAVVSGWFSELSMNLNGVPEHGEVYLFGDPFADEFQMRCDYRDLKKFAKDDGVKVPTFSKIPNSDGAVNAKAEYHVFQECGVTWIAFEKVEPLDCLYNIVNGEFVKDNGPSYCE